MNLVNRNGILWIDFYHQSERIRRSLGLDDTKANRKYAQNQVIPELVYKLNSGMFFDKEEDKKKVPTIGQYIAISLEMHCHERREKTNRDYANFYKWYIEPHFAHKRLDEIKASHINLWQNELLKTLTAKTIKHARTVLNIMFTDAMRDEIIDKNPMALVKVPKEAFKIIKPFSIAEVKKIIDHAPEQMKAFFAIGFYTGMRTGEIIGLKWEDIDFVHEVISIRRSRRQGKEDLPKTMSSIRDVDILEVLMPYLLAHRKICSSKSLYLFETYEGKPYNDAEKIRYHVWKKILKELDLPYQQLYHMRHTFATVMIENGEDILWVSNMLGHRDSVVTLNRYARFTKRREKKRRGTFLLEYV